MTSWNVKIDEGDIVDVAKAFAESYDKHYNNIAILDRVHHKVHEGELFSSTHLFTGIADTNSVEMVGITGDKEAHLVVVVKATGEAEVEFEKGTTFTDNGTAVAAVNRNENSSNSATRDIYHTPTVDSSGTVFSYDLIPGGGRQNATVGGETGSRAEFIVAPNSNHLLRVTNTSGSDEKIFIEFLWYEE